MITMLKLGGSLITHKDQPHTANVEMLKQAGKEIRTALDANTNLRLILGHGSGSFGHIPAKKYGTRNGVRNQQEWAGFAEVNREATTLNRIVTDTLAACGLPVLSFSPLSSVRSNQGKAVEWNLTGIQSALEKGLIPLIYGDTIFDDTLGGTILSTEDLFVYIAQHLAEPKQILLAGIEEGVWQDFPTCTKLIPHIADSKQFDAIQGSIFTDVTGGMKEKTRLMQNLATNGDISSARIYSGIICGNTLQALKGKAIGTLISH